MGISSWLGKRSRSAVSGRSHASPRRRSSYQPRLEALEDRWLPSQIGLTVTSLADSGPGTLRAAILTADAGSQSDKFTIGFAVAGTIALQSPLPGLNNGIAIQGPGASSLTISPAGGVSLSSAIVTVHSGQTASLSGLTVANGNAGGVFNLGTLTVSGCTVSGNSAFVGGGIESAGTSLTVNASTISGNSASESGGGIMVFGGMLTVAGSTISGNSTFAGGGGIFIEGSYPSTITSSTISGNTAIISGGGIFNNSEGNLTISGSTLSGNTAVGVVFSNPSGVFPIPGVGGALANFGAMTVSRCTLAGNSATGVEVGGVHYASQGGAIANGGTMTVRDSFFIATNSGATNSADLGGGIYNSAFLDVRGSTFTDNTASDSGGAIYNLGTATLQECSLSKNTAGSEGGGIFNGASGTLVFKDSTALDNLALLGADIYNLGALTLDDSTVGVLGS
jgi:predicted outer membrane repeat protein